MIFTFGDHAAANPPFWTPRTPSSEDQAVIEKRKVVLVRRGQIARDFPERKTATVSYPVIKGLSDPAVLRKVRSMLRVKNVFDYSLAEYREDAWLTEFDYKVNYNKNFILDITFTQSGVGAYPDTHVKHFAINLKTGEIIKARDVFNSTSLTELAQTVDKKLQAEIKQIIEEAARNNDSTAEEETNIPELFKDLKFQTSDLDEFSINDKGITFLYDAGFPHVVQALEPEGQYFFSYAELALYIKREGLLAKFVR